MTKLRNRGCVSVSKSCGERLAAFADENHVSASQIVEYLMQPVIDGEVAVTARPRDPQGRPTNPAPSRAEIDRRAYIRQVLAGMAEAVPENALSARVQIPISRTLAGEIDDQLERRRAAGRPVDESDLLDLAINRMLDQLEAVPPSSICALCTEQIEGAARLLPLGKDDAMVWICWPCDTEHPRKGRYSFSERAGAGRR